MDFPLSTYTCELPIFIVANLRLYTRNRKMSVLGFQCVLLLARDGRQMILTRD